MTLLSKKKVTQDSASYYKIQIAKKKKKKKAKSGLIGQFCNFFQV